MRIIFIDIEGGLTRNGEPDQAAVTRLNALAERTGAQLVITSTWRGQEEAALAALLRDWGVSAPVAGLTDDLSYLDFTTPIGLHRGDEVGQWLDRHPGVEDFVILDDDDDMGGLKPFLVKVEENTGLTDEQAEVAARALMDGVTPWSSG